MSVSRYIAYQLQTSALSDHSFIIWKMKTNERKASVQSKFRREQVREMYANLATWRRRKRLIKAFS